VLPVGSGKKLTPLATTNKPVRQQANEATTNKPARQQTNKATTNKPTKHERVTTTITSKTVRVRRHTYQRKYQAQIQSLMPYSHNKDSKGKDNNSFSNLQAKTVRTIRTTRH
jgi:hypothetical protein